MAPAQPPFVPMLARLERELPRGQGLLYEPKWDGFRCVVGVSAGGVEMWSRNGRPLARYFPEIVGPLGELDRSFIADGELVIARGSGFDFEALLHRLHPAASRVERLARETPALLMLFDLVVLDRTDLSTYPFVERRELLRDLVGAGRGRVMITPATTDVSVAQGWLDASGAGGVDGVMAKSPDLPYLPGKRRMIKVKRERTADCVVAGFRWHPNERTVGSLLLGLYEAGILRHVGLASSFSAARRKELLRDVAPAVVELAGHPWEKGFNIGIGPVGRLPGAASRWAEGGAITWVPLDPRLVCEATYDHIENGRFRHPLRFKRWRPDRDASSCTFEQFPRDEPQLRGLVPRG